jgi:hypothetical protein
MDTAEENTVIAQAKEKGLIGLCKIPNPPHSTINWYKKMANKEGDLKSE